ncbi:multidrug ABC transporter ATP-binding protein [Microlunatus endophyticus]|uniref:Multidrug ABC transporter ATP-binding protein n=1 Tax=Microlunatus endophyticus TaxID=1716077 RepID=A0A917SF02_9ACTN|nr:ABC transporter ATP-binding protein [Microlunatus endophyticus]GGL75893.1 multidrug ABC transporter ATP-binding protein [Microlunatus endophyticus]
MRSVTAGQLPVAGPREIRAAGVDDLGAERPAVIVVVLINGLAAAAGLVAPWLLGRIIDTIQAGSSGALPVIDRLAFAALVVTAVQIVLTWWALTSGYRLGERAAARVRERLLRRTLALPPRMADQLPAGDLISRGSTDTALVAAALRSALPEVLVAVLHAVFLIGAALVLDLRLGLCGLAGLIGVAVAVRWYRRGAGPAYLAVAATGAEIADVVTNTATGARTVELLGLEARRTEASESAIGLARSARLRALRLRTVLFPAAEISLVLPVVAVLLVGGLLYADGLVSLGIVVTATAYLRQLSGPLDTLMLWIEQLQGAGASYARVEGLAGIHDTPGTASVPTVPDPRTGTGGDRLRVADAYFSYTGERDVLRGIDLQVRSGERLAIVGASGAGKSTLARLLAGLDRPRAGSVTISGVPVADLSPEQLRAHVVLITQDHHVFRETVRDNLLIARPDATDAELIAALAVVGATWATDLRRGRDTEIGTELILDGARAQQLSLARVLVADPHTVILDEATSALDPRTARQTEQSLAGVLHGRTVIAIAHRLQTAHDADRIAVMDAGRLVELGTHEELVRAGGTYGRLWRTWQGNAG